MTLWSLLYGAIVGLSLGLTGGGGALFAVPLLVYGLDLAVREAASISLAAVGAISAFGCWRRWRSGSIDVRTGLAFAASGALGAPIGVRIADVLSETVTLGLFATLMIVAGLRMQREANRPLPARFEDDASIADPASFGDGDSAGPSVDADGAALTAPAISRTWGLMLLGLVCGILSGLLGVGGGFIIVPSLVLVAHVPIHRAVSTSLMVITLISAAGLAAHLQAGRHADVTVMGLFVAGGVLGMLGGQRLGARLSARALQQVFVWVLLGVAVFVLIFPPKHVGQGGARGHRTEARP